MNCYTESSRTFAFEEGLGNEGIPFLARLVRGFDWGERRDFPGIGERSEILLSILNAFPPSDPYGITLTARTAALLPQEVPHGFTVDEYAHFMEAALKTIPIAQVYILNMASREGIPVLTAGLFLMCTPQVRQEFLEFLHEYADSKATWIYQQLQQTGVVK